MKLERDEWLKIYVSSYKSKADRYDLQLKKYNDCTQNCENIKKPT